MEPFSFLFLKSLRDASKPLQSSGEFDSKRHLTPARETTMIRTSYSVMNLARFDLHPE